VPNTQDLESDVQWPLHGSDQFMGFFEQSFDRRGQTTGPAKAATISGGKNRLLAYFHPEGFDWLSRMIALLPNEATVRLLVEFYFSKVNVWTKV
jgi:hypothetical protein